MDAKTESMTASRFYCGRQWVINIMGDGKIINGGTGELFEVYTCDVHLYGGTYISSGSKPVISFDGSSAKVYLHNDAKLEGLTALKMGNLYVNDAADVTNLKLTGGKVNVATGWNGEMVLDATALMVDGKIPAANAVVTGGVLNGTVTDTAGNALYYIDGQLGYKPFNAADKTNYCRVCNAYVEWEEMPTSWTVVYPMGQHWHYYLAEENVTNTASLLFRTNQGESYKPEDYNGGPAGFTA